MANRSRGSPKKANQAGKTIEGFQVSTGGRSTPSSQNSQRRKGSNSPKGHNQRSRNNLHSVNTDTEISRNNNHRQSHGRDLQVWQADGPEANGHATDGIEDRRYKNKPWDQFAANEQKFGYKSTWDEDLYTTKLDKSKATITEAQAERIAREIQQGVSTNAHVQEERTKMDFQGEDDDEEAKFSAVQSKPNDSKFSAAQSKSNDSIYTKPVGNETSLTPQTSATNVPAWSNPAQSVAAVTNKPNRPASSMPVDVQQRNKEYRQVRSELANPGGGKKASPSSSKPKHSPSESSWYGEKSQVHALDLQVGQPYFNADTRREFNEYKKAKELSQSPSDKSFQGALTSLPISRTSSAVADTTQKKAAEIETRQDESAAASQVTQSAPKSKLNPNAPEFKLNPNAEVFVPKKAPPTQSQQPSVRSSPTSTPKSGPRKTQFNNPQAGVNGRPRNAYKGGRTMEGGPSGLRPLPQYPVPPFPPQGMRPYEANEHAVPYPGNQFSHPALGFSNQPPLSQMQKPGNEYSQFDYPRGNAAFAYQRQVPQGFAPAMYPQPTFYYSNAFTQPRYFA